jgi:tetratricopeptide (TPR) repeat protein
VKATWLFLWLGVITLLTTRSLSLVSKLYANVGYVSVTAVYLTHVDSLAYPSCSALKSEAQLADSVVQNFADRTLQARMWWLKGHCEKVIEISTDSPPMQRWLRAQALLGLGRTNEAAGLYRELGAELLPSKLAEKARTEGHPDYVRWLELALLTHPNRLVAEELVKHYARSGEQQRVSAIWQTLADVTNPDIPDHWWAIGQLREGQKDLLEAVSAYQQGAVLSSEPYPYWMRAGELLQQLGNLGEAETAYQAARQARPDLEFPYLRLGDIARANREYATAVAWYEQAARVSPQSIWSPLGLGQVYFDQNDCATALGYFQQAYELGPDNVWPNYYLARCYYELKNRTRAAFHMQNVFAYFSDRPWPWALQVATWAEAKGEQDWALTAYRKALEWNPQDSLARSKIEQLQR